MPADAALGAAICAALRRQAEKLGLSLGDEPVWEAASFETRVDPYSREKGRVGTWRGQSRFGTVTLFPDGRVFAEYQVLLPHPAQANRYVEAVRVWGEPNNLKGEAVVAAYPA